MARTTRLSRHPQHSHDPPRQKYRIPAVCPHAGQSAGPRSHATTSSPTTNNRNASTARNARSAGTIIANRTASRSAKLSKPPYPLHPGRPAWLRAPSSTHIHGFGADCSGRGIRYMWPPWCPASRQHLSAGYPSAITPQGLYRLGFSFASPEVGITSPNAPVPEGGSWGAGGRGPRGYELARVRARGEHAPARRRPSRPTRPNTAP